MTTSNHEAQAMQSRNGLTSWTSSVVNYFINHCTKHILYKHFIPFITQGAINLIQRQKGFHNPHTPGAWEAGGGAPQLYEREMEYLSASPKNITIFEKTSKLKIYELMYIYVHVSMVKIYMHIISHSSPINVTVDGPGQRYTDIFGRTATIDIPGNSCTILFVYTI